MTKRPAQWVRAFNKLFGNFLATSPISEISSWSFRTTFCIPGSFSSSFLLILRYRSSLSSSPWGKSRVVRSAVFFKENSKWRKKIHRLHSTDSSDSCQEGHSTILLAHTKFFTSLILHEKLMRSLYSYSFDFNWRQSYLATVVTPENCSLSFVAQFAWDQMKEESNKNTEKRRLFFPATFEQPSRNKKQPLTFLSDSVLMKFLRNYGKRFGKFRATRLGLGEG